MCQHIWYPVVISRLNQTAFIPVVKLSHLILYRITTNCLLRKIMHGTLIYTHLMPFQMKWNRSSQSDVTCAIHFHFKWNTNWASTHTHIVTLTHTHARNSFFISYLLEFLNSFFMPRISSIFLSNLCSC